MKRGIIIATYASEDMNIKNNVEFFKKVKLRLSTKKVS